MKNVTKMDRVRVIDLHLDELEDHLRRIIDERLKPSPGLINKGEELLSRRQVRERLGIAYSTLHKYTERNIIPSYKIGNRTYFKWSEIVNAALRVKKG